MILQLLKKTKNLHLERTYPVAAELVWRAWTDPEMLQQWWGPEGTTVTECELELRVGGTISIVLEAGTEMGKYQGTRWPMSGTFSHIEEPSRLTYEARSWTEGEEQGSTIHHRNDITLAEHDGVTTLRLHIAISKIGPKAKMAAFGMKWGYKAQLDQLAALLERAA